MDAGLLTFRLRLYVNIYVYTHTQAHTHMLGIYPTTELYSPAQIRALLLQSCR